MTTSSTIRLPYFFRMCSKNLLKVDIRISIEKLRKYMIHCKAKLITNHFKEFLLLQKK